jgi:hypothetical protein
MEPRPLKSPQRPAPQPAQTPPSADRANWTSPSSDPSPAFRQSIPTADPGYAGGTVDPASQGPWYGPPPTGVAPGEPIYSPGPALTPIDGSRGARVLGPVLALLVLAAIVGTAVFLMLRLFGDDGPRDNELAAATGTAAALAAPSATTDSSGEPTQENGAVAGADETAAPSEEAIDSPPEQTPTPEDAEPAPEPTRNAPPSARSLLPAVSDLGSNYERTEDDKRTRDAVADSFSKPDEALSKLEGWKWRENAYRTFEIPAANNPDVNDTTVINISIHRFGDEQGAKDALNYFAEDVIATQGLEEFRIDRIGEQTRALRGNKDGSNVVLYVRNGDYLIRIGGYSPEGDPTDDLIALAKSIIE